MNDLQALNGKPRVLRVDGREYRFYPLTLDDMGDLQAWVESVSPDPFSLAHAQINGGRFTVDQGKYLLKTAMEMAARGAPKLGTDEADLLLQSPDGVKEVLYLSVRKGDPAFTRGDALALFRTITQNDVATLFRTSGLVDAGILGGADPDPKAPGSATPTPADGPPSTGGPSTTS